jgi:hypothetical protein
MATRSLIGIKLDNEIVKTIYCHWDGYPSHTGKLLIENYSTPAAITELMELGDLSSLAESPAKCKAYHRDRNEPWGMVEPRDTDVNELGTLANDYGVVYNEDFEWECSRPDYLSGTLTPLEILSELALN